MKRLSVVFQSLLMAVAAVYGAAPANYYKSCEGKSGKSLLQALHEVINNHTNVGYDGLWTVYQTSDVRANGTVWDMYSTKEWVVGKEHCGNYKNVGDCINREHSFPKSWFNDASPMMSDAFHIYPTDGKVNGQRSNFPYGECSNGTTLASSGSVKALGRFGTSTFPGYSGKVFEPDDQYKGDFARSYFYMAACYN
ncbi:MAG: endonuclease, partial [Muribaculaceae bacterium]|nr:endonuclease [Muribaculaceae bacterium]